MSMTIFCVYNNTQVDFKQISTTKKEEACDSEVKFHHRMK